MRSRIVPLVALFLALLTSGCVSSAQRAVAKELDFEATYTESKVLDLEVQLATAVNRRDAAGIQGMIVQLQGLRETWKEKARPAEGEVQDAAREYERSLDTRVSEFEAGRNAALYNSAAESGEMVRFQERAMAESKSAMAKLERYK